MLSCEITYLIIGLFIGVSLGIIITSLLVAASGNEIKEASKK